MLTKSDYKIYLESPIHLWALKHGKYNHIEDEYEKHLKEQGYEVEKLAQQYALKYISPKCNFQKIYQTDDLYSRADIEYKDDIYEVKSSTKIKQEDKDDISFQYYVAKNIGSIDRIFIIYLNKEYIKGENLDLKELFVVKDFTEIAKDNLEKTEINVSHALNVINKANIDELSSCYKPSTCPCKELCHPNLPEYSIYDIPRISKKNINELLRLRITDIKNIPSNFELPERQKLQVECTKKEKIIIDKERIEKDLDGIEYPIYFLDYETYSWAIPQYKGHKVYEDVVFQFSIHVKKTPNSNLVHYEFLSKKKLDPMEEVIEDLKSVIKEEGSIIVWNKSLEKGCNESMARVYPKHEQFFLNLNRRIYDIGDIFKYQMYVDPKFKGSWSIKNVLPVISPDLSYFKLDIHKGDEAMTNWYKMTHDDMDMKQREEIYKNLLKYCELDTFAMYRIWEYLNEIII
ncbi:MAG: DUF2779 domain-containing protein [Candidatus Dojkabacteria bacterium]|nr:DUF2779 domain-containing protein [Candidatus Dojkabacteria bacterium]